MSTINITNASTTTFIVDILKWFVLYTLQSWTWTNFIYENLYCSDASYLYAWILTELEYQHVLVWMHFWMHFLCIWSLSTFGNLVIWEYKVKVFCRVVRLRSFEGDRGFPLRTFSVSLGEIQKFPSWGWERERPQAITFNTHCCFVSEDCGESTFMDTISLNF